MAGHSNENRGALFTNKSKTSEHPTWPDLQGNINVDGKEYWIDGWHKVSKDKKTKFVSLSVKPKEAKKQDDAPPPADEDGRPF